MTLLFPNDRPWLLHFPKEPVPEAQNVTESDPGLLILLSLPSWCWNYRCAPRCLIYVVLGINTRASRGLGTVLTDPFLYKGILKEWGLK